MSSEVITEYYKRINKVNFLQDDKFITPREIKEYLDQRIIGQEAAKRAAAMLVCNHINNVPGSLLMAGPTGSGKSEIWRLLEKDFGSAMIRIIDSTRLSGDGWKGSFHLRDIWNGIPESRRGKVIIVFDEFDKVTCEPVGSTYNNYSNVIQNNLLTMLSRSTLRFGAEDRLPAFDVDCSNISIVMLGAFERLREMQKARQGSIGFGSPAAQTSTDSNAPITVEDLIAAGMRREICGRISRIVQMDEPDDATFEKIAYMALEDLKVQHNCDISVDPALMSRLAIEAKESGLGARYVQHRLSNMLDDIRYDLPWADSYHLSCGQS